MRQRRSPWAVGGARPQASVPQRRKVLILAKEKYVQKTCSHAARIIGLDAVVLRNVTLAYQRLVSGKFAAVLLHLRLPGDQGLDILERIKRQHPQVPVIVLTGYGTVQSAVQAMKIGAYDYLITPVRLEELVVALTGAAENSRSQAEWVWSMPLRLKSSRVQAERSALLGALVRARGNKRLAAKLLGIGRTTLYDKIKTMAIRAPKRKSA